MLARKGVYSWVMQPTSFFSHDLSLGAKSAASKGPVAMPSAKTVQADAARPPMQMPPQSLRMQIK